VIDRTVDLMPQGGLSKGMRNVKIQSASRHRQKKILGENPE